MVWHMAPPRAPGAALRRRRVPGPDADVSLSSLPRPSPTLPTAAAAPATPDCSRWDAGSKKACPATCKAYDGPLGPVHANYTQCLLCTNGFNYPLSCTQCKLRHMHMYYDDYCQVGAGVWGAGGGRRAVGLTPGGAGGLPPTQEPPTNTSGRAPLAARCWCPEPTTSSIISLASKAACQPASLSAPSLNPAAALPALPCLAPPQECLSVSALGCAVARQAPTKISTRPLQGPCTRCDKGKVAVWATARGVDILDYPLLPAGGGVRAAAASLPKPQVSAAQCSTAPGWQAPTSSSQSDSRQPQLWRLPLRLPLLLPVLLPNSAGVPVPPPALPCPAHRRCRHMPRHPATPGSRQRQRPPETPLPTQQTVSTQLLQLPLLPRPV